MSTESNKETTPPLSTLKSGESGGFWRKLKLLIMAVVTTLAASVVVKIFVTPAATLTATLISLSSGIITICESQTAKTHEIILSVCDLILPHKPPVSPEQNTVVTRQKSEAEKQIQSIVDDIMKNGLSALSAKQLPVKVEHSKDEQYNRKMAVTLEKYLESKNIKISNSDYVLYISVRVVDLAPRHKVTLSVTTRWAKEFKKYNDLSLEVSDYLEDENQMEDKIRILFENLAEKAFTQIPINK